MNMLWRISAEVSVPPWDTRPPYTAGFINVLMWAPSQDVMKSRLSGYFRTFEWTLLSIDEAEVVPDDFVFDNEEMEDLLLRARLDIGAILLGDLHSYEVI